MKLQSYETVLGKNSVSGHNINNIIDNLKGENPLKKFQEQKNIEETLKDFFSEILIERG